MHNSQCYRDKALQARRLARHTTMPDVIATLERLALEYETIADGLGRREAHHPEPPPTG
jgi:hypothetical protein